MADAGRRRAPPRSARATLPPVPGQMRRMFHEGAAEAQTRARVRLTVASETPRVFIAHDFLSKAELAHFDRIVTASEGRWTRSVTDDYGGADVVSDDRTSRNIHLKKACDGVVRRVEARAAELVGLAAGHAEPLQLVSYGPGDEFSLHHDMGPMESVRGDVDAVADGASAYSVTAHQPRRLATVFVYLTTLPEAAGGETVFPFASPELAVRPVAGSAAVFCNVLADGRPDALACHSARPVLEGRKVGLNIWLDDADMSCLAAGHPPWLARRLREAPEGGTLAVLNMLCQTCGRGDGDDAMLICDGCDDCYHTHCLTPPLAGIPDGDWYCAACNEYQAAITCETCGGGDGHDGLLLCDNCDSAYHLHCLDPPLAAVPEGDWYCPDCAKAKKPRRG